MLCGGGVGGGVAATVFLRRYLASPGLTMGGKADNTVRAPAGQTAGPPTSLPPGIPAKRGRVRVAGPAELPGKAFRLMDGSCFSG